MYGLKLKTIAGMLYSYSAPFRLCLCRTWPRDKMQSAYFIMYSGVRSAWHEDISSLKFFISWSPLCAVDIQFSWFTLAYDFVNNNCFRFLTDAIKDVSRRNFVDSKFWFGVWRWVLYFTKLTNISAIIFDVGAIWGMN